jgi:alpha-D-ribose 1-methylphosphonate 5-triphosphate synthase subunit PhnH
MTPNTNSPRPANPAAAQAAMPLLPGFDDPVGAAQQTFRAALDAFAQPGSLQTADAVCGVPDGLSPAMTALLLTLADVDTPVWLPAAVPAAVRAFLRFHCGCPLVDEPAAAAFVAVPAGHAAPALDACAQGEPAYPDRSATLLVEVASLSAHETPAVMLHGPGIETTRALHAAGLPDDFWTAWRANHAHFPLGVDLLLTSGNHFCGLTRTTHAEA